VKRAGEENREGGDGSECCKDVSGSRAVIGENVEQMVTPQSITKMPSLRSNDGCRDPQLGRR
jgi:hypothetical protein